MKKIFNVLAFAIVAIFFNSCEKNGSLDEPKTYTVSFAASGDVSVSMRPMTKGSMTEGDLIGIMAYVSNDGGTKYSPYQYGLFDDISKATIELIDGKLYKFTALLVKNGKNVLRSRIQGSYSFYDTYSESLRNQFNAQTYTLEWEGDYGPRYQLNYELTGFTGTSHSHFVESYYGSVDDVEPSENMTVVLDMEATFGAVELNVDWDEISDGHLQVSVEGASFTLEYPTTQFASLVTLERKLSYIYKKADASSSAKLNVNLVRADGSTLQLVTDANIPIQKKMITTINLRVSESTTDASISATIEDVQMGEGSTVSIDTSTGTVDVQVGTN